jgi:hypothetical protein
MDERLERALDFSNYQKTIEAHKKNLEARVEKIKRVYYENAVFLAELETIRNIDTLKDILDDDSGIVVDSRNIPVMIESLDDLKNTLVDAYFRATNEHYNGIAKLNKMRSLKKLIEE